VIAHAPGNTCPPRQQGALEGIGANVGGIKPATQLARKAEAVSPLQATVGKWQRYDFGYLWHGPVHRCHRRKRSHREHFTVRLQTPQQRLGHDRVPNPLWRNDQRRSQDRGRSMPVKMFAILEFVHSAAVGALGLTGLAYVQKNVGMRIPGFHFGQRARAHDSTLVVQVFGQEFDFHFS
jgi:hypothetical protein